MKSYIQALNFGLNLATNKTVKLDMWILAWDTWYHVHKFGIKYRFHINNNKYVGDAKLWRNI
jgi:hypothetical protein